MNKDGSDMPPLHRLIYSMMADSPESPELVGALITNRLRYDAVFREGIWDDPDGLGDVIRDHVEGIITRICRAIDDGRLEEPSTKS